MVALCIARFANVVLAALIAFSATPAWSVSLRRAVGCEALASSHDRKLLRPDQPSSRTGDHLSCLSVEGSAGVAASASAHHVWGDAPTCSPYCGQQLDAVVVLGLSEAPLDGQKVNRSRHVAKALLEHFALGGQEGALIGFADVSHGAGNAHVIAGLTDDRQALTKAVQSWRPQLGGMPVGLADLNGIEQDPALLAMLRRSRPGVPRTLLLLGTDRQGTGEPHLQLLARNTTLSVAKSTVDPAAGLNWDVMEALLSACPAVVLDPELKCGRMRWGSKG